MKKKSGEGRIPPRESRNQSESGGGGLIFTLSYFYFFQSGFFLTSTLPSQPTPHACYPLWQNREMQCGPPMPPKPRLFAGRESLDVTITRCHSRPPLPQRPRRLVQGPTPCLPRTDNRAIPCMPQFANVRLFVRCAAGPADRQLDMRGWGGVRSTV